MHPTQPLNPELLVGDVALGYCPGFASRNEASGRGQGMSAAMQTICLMFASLLTAAEPSVADPAGPTPVPLVNGGLSGYSLAWSDEFDGSMLDTSAWDYRTDSKANSVQKKENVSVGNGFLHLAVKHEKAGTLDFTGAGVISKRTFTYGYYEARMKVPPGGGWHTSFWAMLHGVTALDGSGPEVSCQEVDFIEQDSHQPTLYHVNVHRWKGGHAGGLWQTIEAPDLSSDFHVFGGEFTPSDVKFYLDGKLMATRDVSMVRVKDKDGVARKQAFEHGPQNIWLTTISYGVTPDKIDTAKLPSEALFDYVRYYEKRHEQ
jgi:beta-glucanase (GH16 family)